MKISVYPLRRHSIREIDAAGRTNFLDACRAAAARAAERLATAARGEVSARAKRRTGVLEKSISTMSYSGLYGVGAYTGWERTPLKRKSTFQDGSGRIRRVSTAADVGGILEYSQTRQLRHIQPAYDAHADELADQLENEIDELLDSMGL